MKFLMAVSVMVRLMFQLMHMYGNTKLFISKEAFNEYSEHLRVFLEPIFPRMWFLWCFRMFMLLCIAVHMFCAITLWKRAKKNVGTKRYQSKGAGRGNYVAFAMRWGGITMILFLIAHILQFTAEVWHQGYAAGPRNEHGHIIDPATRVVLGFQVWWVVLIYAVAMVAVCMHVAHGFQSAFMTFGLNTSKQARKILSAISGAIAALLFIGFMATPVLILATNGTIVH